MSEKSDTHSKVIGYIVWIFGFLGSHRFYYGKVKTGILWFFTLGLLGVGWLIDLFLIPSMDREADSRFSAGPHDYTVAWILLAAPFIGGLGIHSLYLGKWVKGLVHLSLVGVGALFPPLLIIPGLIWLYDLCTLNSQVDALNRTAGSVSAGRG